jgi:hypothetical protein
LLVSSSVELFLAGLGCGLGQCIPLLLIMSPFLSYVPERKSLRQFQVSKHGDYSDDLVSDIFIQAFPSAGLGLKASLRQSV